MKDVANQVAQLVPEEHRALLFSFFLVFSRFEYALKRAGFVNAPGGRVSANWDAFASKHNASFDPANSEDCNKHSLFQKKSAA